MRESRTLLAEKRRKSEAHGASRGKTEEITKPRSGERWDSHGVEHCASRVQSRFPLTISGGKAILLARMRRPLCRPQTLPVRQFNPGHQARFESIIPAQSDRRHHADEQPVLPGELIFAQRIGTFGLTVQQCLSPMVVIPRSESDEGSAVSFVHTETAIPRFYSDGDDTLVAFPRQ